MTISFSASASLFASTGLIVLLSSACFLFPVVLDRNNSFYIRKPFISTDNTTATKTLKGTI